MAAAAPARHRPDRDDDRLDRPGAAAALLLPATSSAAAAALRRLPAASRASTSARSASRRATSSAMAHRRRRAASAVASPCCATRIGKATRAVADNPALAAASGIDVDRVIRVVWVVGGALAALAGVLLGARPERQLPDGLPDPAAHVRRRSPSAASAPPSARWSAASSSACSSQLSTLWIPTELKNVGALRPDRHPARPAAGHPGPRASGSADGRTPWTGAASSPTPLQRVVGLDTVVFALAAIGLNVHFGYTGLLNFGQAAFMAVGAYGIGITVADFGLPLWVGVLVGLVGAVVLALLLGIPTLRLRADYLAIVTIAAAEIIRLLVPLGRRFDDVHRRLRRPQRLRRRLLRPQPVPRRAATASARVELQRTASCGCSPSAGSLVALSLPARLPADAQPVGPGAQGDPRGRGRRPQPRQERLRLQDAGLVSAASRRLGRLRARARPGVGAARTTTAPSSPSSPTPSLHPRRRRPGCSARSSAR